MLWEVPVGREPAGIVWHRGRLIVGVMGTDSFAVINPETREIERQIPVGRGAHTVFVQPDGKALWATSRVQSRIAESTTARWRCARVRVPGGPDCISFDPRAGCGHAALGRPHRPLDPRTASSGRCGVRRIPHGIFFQSRRANSRRALLACGLARCRTRGSLPPRGPLRRAGRGAAGCAPAPLPDPSTPAGGGRPSASPTSSAAASPRPSSSPTSRPITASAAIARLAGSGAARSPRAMSSPATPTGTGFSAAMRAGAVATPPAAARGRRSRPGRALPRARPAPSSAARSVPLPCAAAVGLPRAASPPPTHCGWRGLRLRHQGWTAHGYLGDELSTRQPPCRAARAGAVRHPRRQVLVMHWGCAAGRTPRQRPRGGRRRLRPAAFGFATLPPAAADKPVAAEIRAGGAAGRPQSRFAAKATAGAPPCGVVPGPNFFDRRIVFSCLVRGAQTRFAAAGRPASRISGPTPSQSSRWYYRAEPGEGPAGTGTPAPFRNRIPSSGRFPHGAMNGIASLGTDRCNFVTIL